MGTERKVIQNMDDWMLDKNRSARQQSRRRQITQASDLLGGGFGPTATLIQDWNDDLVTFNGFFYSVAGLSLNSPDASQGWAGIVISEGDREFGIQEVWTSHSGAPPRRWTRRWSTIGGVRSYTAWVGDGVWQTGGITAIGSCTISSQQWRLAGQIVFLDVVITLTANFVAAPDGQLADPPMLQMPPAAIPTFGPSAQMLMSSAVGPIVGYSVLPTGQIVMSATGPGLTLPSTAVLSLGGSYSL